MTKQEIKKEIEKIFDCLNWEQDFEEEDIINLFQRISKLMTPGVDIETEKIIKELFEEMSDFTAGDE